MAHLDLKPQNVLMVGRRAKIADLGLAKLCLPDSKATCHTAHVGTEPFMDPAPAEAASGVTFGKSSDIYSFGALAWCLLFRDVVPKCKQCSKHARLQQLKAWVRCDSGVYCSIECQRNRSVGKSTEAAGKLIESPLSDFPSNIGSIIERCLSPVQTERPTIRQVLTYLTGLKCEYC